LDAMIKAIAKPELWLRIWHCLVLFALLACVSGLARAQDCTIATQPIAFGTYDPIETVTPLVSSTQLTVNCRKPNKVPFVAALSTGSSGTYAQRHMESGGSQLPYNLYRDAGLTVVFGDGSAGTQSATCTTGIDGNGCTGSNPPGPDLRSIVPVFGRVPTNADPVAGLHSDTITVTVTF